MKRIGLAAWIVCLFAFAAALFAAPPVHYGGRALPEWRALIKAEPLSELGRPEIIAGLIEIILADCAPWADRRNAALTLGRIGEPAREATPHLVSLLHADEADPQATRLWALRALALLGRTAETSVVPVARIVADDQAPLLERTCAMETLARCGPAQPLTVATLVAVLRSDRVAPQRDNRNELRLAAAESLGLLGPAAAAAIPELIRAAQADWPLLRRAAAATLGSIGATAEIALPTLVDLILLDEANEVREAAADALSRIGRPAEATLARLLADPEAEVRLLAIRGWQSSDAIRSVGPLRPLLNDDVSLVRVAAASAILMRDADETTALTLLVRELASDDRETRIAAYRTLQREQRRLTAVRAELLTLPQRSDLPAQTRSAALRLLKQADAATPAARESPVR